MSPKKSNNLEEQIKEIISKISGMDPKEISSNAHFIKDLGMDSIQVLEISVALEKTFGVRIEEDKFPLLTTINSVIKEIKPLLK